MLVVGSKGGPWDDLGEFDVRLSVGEGNGSSFRERLGASRLVELQRSLREELGESVFEKSDIEQRLREVSKGASAATAIEAWLSWIVGRDLTRRTRSLRAFVDGSGDGFDENVSMASFLLMGAQATTGKILPRKRLVGRQAMRAQETVAWSWTTAGRDKTEFRAVFVTGEVGDEFEPEFPFGGVVNEASGEVVEQDGENKTWCAEADGELFLIWEASADAGKRAGRSRSLLPTTAKPVEIDVALKLAKCDAAAAEAARTAATEAREQRTLDSFGERLWQAPGSCCVASVEVVADVDRRDDAETADGVTITGLHVRANLRRAAARLAVAFNEDGNPRSNKSPEDLLRSALATVAALEDEAASERARADRAVAATNMERERAEAESRTAKAEREVFAAELKAANDRAARAEAKTAAAVGALRAVADLELAGDYDDDRATYNPFVALDTEADRTWSRLECGDEDVDRAAADARRAAARCALACSRARTSTAKFQDEKSRLAEEKRVLIAELRRLRAAADDKLAEARADADEARMVQRQYAAHAKKLKDERKQLARRLAACTCGATTNILAPNGDVSETTTTTRRVRNGSGVAKSNGTVVVETSAPARRDDEAAVEAQPQEKPPPDVEVPPKDDDEDRRARKAALEAKLHGCRERQKALDAILKHQPDNPKIQPLKSKLDLAIVKLERQLDALSNEADPLEPAPSEARTSSPPPPKDAPTLVTAMV
ncbi:hypothetical protein CTAYLR_005280 [Chrysophaeum taylorii]|uniref:Uncharacterized protein n=1 Tax=Chrysophaeum taylorii TaxID=2483200 RepID=A0AAD7UJ79_9STRA|nr:hypothetical protein CTAYLR_005280 [Chrysophaeum taylorii]